MTVAARAVKVAAVGVVVVLALVTILTALRTELPRNPGVMSDALGPDPGEAVGEYLERAGASLTVGGGRGEDSRDDAAAGDDVDDSDDSDDSDDDTADPRDPDAPRWALVSASGAWTASDAESVTRDLPRVSALVVQVPVDGVAMPVTEVVLAEPVAGEDTRLPTFDRGLRRVAAGLEASVDGGAPAGVGSAPDAGGGVGRAPDPGDRAVAAASLTAARIDSGAPAIIGLVVRGTPAQLGGVAQRPGVRAVEALPADAVWGRFAVRPLQPQQLETASPLPDTAPVPVG